MVIPPVSLQHFDSEEPWFMVMCFHLLAPSAYLILIFIAPIPICCIPFVKHSFGLSGLWW